MGCNRMILMLAVFCCIGHLVMGRNGTMDDWIRLTNTLFSNYTKQIYPVYNFCEPLTIETSMMLLSIIDFDELAGVITVNIVLISKWTDFRLTWDPEDYGGIKDININGSNVWKPSLFVQSTAQDLEPIGSNNFHVRVNYTGECYELPGRLVRSSCAVDMRYFPLDSHVCDIIIRQWGVYDDEIKLVYTNKKVIMSVFSPNGEWNIDETSVSHNIFGGIPTNTIVFSLYISRKSRFFIISLIIPVLILCFLNPFVFLLPASSGERISYTITMFLSLAVYMTIIGDNLPKVSDNMAGMTYFLLFALIYSGALILLTIFTLRCECISDVNKFPNSLRTITRYLYRPKQQHPQFQLNDSKNEEAGTKEQTQSGENGCMYSDYYLHKDDVTKLIDTLLFVVSFGIILGGTVLFLVHCYT